MDIVFSLTAIIVLSPIFILTAILIRLDSCGPAIYTQTRVGKQRQPFTMYKFRSMFQDADDHLVYLEEKNERAGPAFKLSDDPRVTRVGKFIRKTCIDELPQLFNILKGDMTIVGPRPPLPREVAQYSPYHYKRLEVKSGLTCFWQVTDKKNNLSFDEWVALDVRYIRESSIWVDIGLIFRTLVVIFRKSGDQ